MTKEEFRTCLNEHFYEHTPEEQEKMFDWMYENMCVWTAYTDMASRVTFSREWLKGYKIKDMNVFLFLMLLILMCLKPYIRLI